MPKSKSKSKTKIQPSRSKGRRNDPIRKAKREQTRKKYDRAHEAMPSGCGPAAKMGACVAGTAGVAAAACQIQGGAKNSKKSKTKQGKTKKSKTQKKRRSMCTRLTNKECVQPRYIKRCKVTKQGNKGKNAKRAHCRTKKNKKTNKKK